MTLCQNIMPEHSQGHSKNSAKNYNEINQGLLELPTISRYADAGCSLPELTR